MARDACLFAGGDGELERPEREDFESDFVSDLDAQQSAVADSEEVSFERADHFLGADPLNDFDPHSISHLEVREKVFHRFLFPSILGKLTGLISTDFPPVV